MVIAIDGPGGVGKSTVTRRVAADRGFDYLDTGATYRAAALAVLRAGIDIDSPAAVVAVVADAIIQYSGGRTFLNGEDVTDAIRTPEVTVASSAIAANPEVRALVVAMQHAWVAARNGSAVVEGRDIGTVVFPHSELKIFLTARAEVRAARRAADREVAGVAVEEVRAALDERDRADSTRETSPLRPADDAVVIDTSDLSLEQVVAQVLALLDRERRRPRML